MSSFDVGMYKHVPLTFVQILIRDIFRTVLLLWGAKNNVTYVSPNQDGGPRPRGEPLKFLTHSSRPKTSSFKDARECLQGKEMGRKRRRVYLTFVFRARHWVTVPRAGTFRLLQTLFQPLLHTATQHTCSFQIFWSIATDCYSEDGRWPWRRRLFALFFSGSDRQGKEGYILPSFLPRGRC